VGARSRTPIGVARENWISMVTMQGTRKGNSHVYREAFSRGHRICQATVAKVMSVAVHKRRALLQIGLRRS
jgi:hypothetical protein